MKNILLVGNFGSRNFGDELILRSALSLVHESGNMPWVVTANQAETSRQYGVKSFSRLPMGIRSLLSFRWIPTIGAFFRCDAVFFSGGGLFVDRFSLAKWIWGVHGFLALLLRKPIFLIGQSFEIKSATTSWMVRILMKRARLITVRDQASYDYAISQGVVAGKLRFLPDMAFITLLEEAKSLPAKQKGYVAVSLCKWGMTDTEIQWIARRLEHHEHVRCFAFQEGGDDDMRVFHRLQRLLADKNVEMVSMNDPDFLRKFAACEYAITMRLHACLAAIAFGIPLVAIAYQDKVSNIMSDLGMSEACKRSSHSYHQISTQALDLLHQNTYAFRALLVSALSTL